MKMDIRPPGRSRRILAAIALLTLAVVLLARMPRGGVRVRELRIGSPPDAPQADGIAPGTPHGLSFRLDGDAYPVVIHVDGAGRARLIDPAPGADPGLLSAGHLALLPPAHAARSWRRGLAPGCETYLLAVPSTRPADLDRLVRELSNLPPVADRSEAVAAAVGVVEKRLGRVERRDGENCP